MHRFQDLDELDDFAKAPKRLAELEEEYKKFKNGTGSPWSSVRSEQDYLNLKQEYEGHISQVKTEQLDYLKESWSDSKAGSIGLSWVGDSGYLGAAISKRQDKYGLPAHNHLYEGCGVISIFDSLYSRPYLARYPQLINEDDVNYINPRPDCAVHALNNFNHSHGIQKKHDYLSTPYIDLTTKRYDVRGEWHKPFDGVETVRGNIGYVDYRHDEKEGDITTTSFKNKGKVARLEFTHTPKNNLKLLWGGQYIEQDNRAESPTTQWRQQPLLTKNTLNNISIFALGQYTLNNVELELSSRLEHQKVAMDYDWDYIEDKIKNRVFFKGENLQDAINHAKDATQPHNNIARSYGLGVHWHFAPRYTLSFNTSHQERLPNPQELYTHGMHLATNSFEIGNRHLKKERANNYELGLKFTGDKLDYKLASYLYDFDNYIYLQTINEHLGTAQVEHFRQLRINRYDQSKARFYGVEGNIGYQINPKYRLSLFEDYVYGRLHDLPDIVVKYSVFDKQKPTANSPTATHHAYRLHGLAHA